jgi:hypothetical protein
MINKLSRLIFPAVLAATILPNTIFAAGEWRLDHPQLILTETTALYNTSYDDPSQKIAEAAPQTATVTGAYLPKGYEIETWLGKKWIYTTDFTKAIPHDPNFITKTLQLNQTLYLYNYPVQYSKTAFALAPQTVEAVDYWGGFYKIKTWVGDKWLYAPNPNAITELKNDQINQEIKLTANTNVYQSASVDANVLGALASQTVEAFEK